MPPLLHCKQCMALKLMGYPIGPSAGSAKTSEEVLPVLAVLVFEPVPALSSRSRTTGGNIGAEPSAIYSPGYRFNSALMTSWNPCKFQC